MAQKEMLAQAKPLEKFLEGLFFATGMNREDAAFCVEGSGAKVSAQGRVSIGSMALFEALRSGDRFKILLFCSHGSCSSRSAAHPPFLLRAPPRFLRVPRR